MRCKQIVVALLLAVLLAGLPGISRADDPPGKGRTDPVPIQPAHEVLDRSKASITYLELAGEERLTPAAPPTPMVQESPASGGTVLAEFDGETLKVIPDSANQANDLSLGPQPPGLAGQDISAAGSTYLAFEDFETNFIPSGPPRWDRPSATSHYWDDVSCFPVESTGVGSAWPADLSNLNPCWPDYDDYPNDMNSWLIYGPFSLVGADAASLDFFFRIISEPTYDFLFWGASINGNNFYGQKVSGTYTSGPYNNGYNFASLDLTNVPTLGDLTGRSQVWIGFQFFSDNSVQDKGPFIDYITLRRNTATPRYLTSENFDLVSFPNQSWVSFDDGFGGVYWDDVSCYSRSGSWAMWPADNGANAVNVCTGNNYPPNADSWLVHGPLNLRNASEAWVDFYFRNESETPVVTPPGKDGDQFCWMASIDSTNFSGYCNSGSHAAGPYGNGYNRQRFYLSNAGNLGDLRGRAPVWLGFIFTSDGSVQYRGPLVDDVSVVVESNQVFMPMTTKSDPPPPSGALTFENHTGNPVTVELINYSLRTFPDTVGPHTWSNIPPGTYDWLASGVCDSFGKGVVGSVAPANNRAPITIQVNQTTTLNQENGGQFTCN